MLQKLTPLWSHMVMCKYDITHSKVAIYEDYQCLQAQNILNSAVNTIPSEIYTGMVWKKITNVANI